MLIVLSMGHTFNPLAHLDQLIGETGSEKLERQHRCPICNVAGKCRSGVTALRLMAQEAGRLTCW
jgi:hypothetical protein